MQKALAIMLMLSFPGIGSSFVFGQGGGGQSAGVGADAPVSQANRAVEGVVPAAEKYKPVYSEVEPTLTAEQQASIDRMEIHRDRAYRNLNSKLEPVSDHPVEGPKFYKMMRDGTFRSDETEVPGEITKADGTGTLFRNSDVTITGASASVIHEPAHAQIGKNVFYTANWYAARSGNGGSTFTYLNPFTDFPAMCCDQDVAHDVSRNLILWYRQGSMATNGTNQVKLSVSTNGGLSFLTYTWSPTTFDASLTNRWFDYPHLALSNNFLYLVSNVFNASDTQTHRIIVRMPLEQLAVGAAFNYYRWTFTAGQTITPVQGATETMYFGSAESSAGTFRVFSWPESTTTLTSIGRTVPAWTPTNKDGICTVANGRNPCGRADQRVTAGWVAKGVIGFFWNVRQGGGFPYPYINAATFRESDKLYLARPYIYNTGFAFQYGAAAPNIRGDLGIALLAAGGSIGYPRFWVGIDDGYNGVPPGWELYHIVSSTNWGKTGTGKEGAGDYLRVRQFSPVGSIWTASGYYGFGSTVAYKGKFVVFGRGREQRAFSRWNAL
ncbi:MAG TPA: hypothetical protein VE842_09250 [Pyrinomonadaceae bacterium]|nr:hypothetical protein [Pyrinomonadaceae bacterium]